MHGARDYAIALDLPKLPGDALICGHASRYAVALDRPKLPATASMSPALRALWYR